MEITTSKDTVVRCRNLSFTYDSEPVLSEITLDINRGDFTCIVGPNGGGKTTFLKLLLGLLRPAGGLIEVFGLPPAQARDRIAYVPQHMTFDPLFPISVIEVVLMGRLSATPVIGSYTAEDRSIAVDSLKQVQAEDLAGRSFAALSGGQRQRVLMARALAAQPEILIMDEPTSSIDLEGAERMFRLFARLNESRTIIMVSHDLSLVCSSVKSVVCIRRTAVVHPTTRLNENTLKEIYGFDMSIIRHDRHCRGAGNQ